MTHHATARTQQRGIPPLIVDLLLQFGREEPAGSGTTKHYFDKPSRRRVCAYAGPLARQLEEHLDTYVVLGPERQVITASHRTERIRHY